jgi:hypothetical protein
MTVQNRAVKNALLASAKPRKMTRGADEIDPEQRERNQEQHGWQGIRPDGPQRHVGVR